MSITKMLSRAVAVALLTSAITLVGIGCGGGGDSKGGSGGGSGNSPKALAKQTYELRVKLEKNQIAPEEAGKQLNELQEKFKTLSEADQKAVEAEVERLEKAGKK